MKRILSYLLIVNLLFAVGCPKKQQEQSKNRLDGTITVSGAWALYPMVVKWAEEFGKVHPEVKIDIAAGGAGKGMADCLGRVVDMAMVSREIHPAEIEKGAWWVSVTRDAVVPTVNINNPALKELVSKGVKKEVLIDIWTTEKIKNWGQVTGSGGVTGAIHVYTRSDACGAAETWAAFLGKKQEDLLGVGIYGDPGLTEAVKKDALGIGFNNINYAYDSKTKTEIEQIKVLPIDVNGNGMIDQDEDFYSSLDKMAEAIAMGKYPSPPARLLHLVSYGKPEKKAVVEFIRWILTDGQKFVPEAGYINLTKEQITEELKKLEGKGNE